MCVYSVTQVVQIPHENPGLACLTRSTLDIHTRTYIYQLVWGRNKLEFQLKPLGVLAPGPAHARPSAQRSIDMS